MDRASIPEPLLRVHDIAVCWDGAIQAVQGLSFDVPAGRVVALLGANGAGKTSTLKAISGLLPAERGALTRGRITLRGEDLAGLSAHQVVQRGISQVLEGRRCFAHLSVEDNLRLGGLVRRPSRRELAEAVERIYARLPRLKAKQRLQAGYLSGGEQQMLALGRALMARPQLVLLDEASMGLAPQMVEEIFATVRELNTQDGTSFVLSDQNAVMALAHADLGHLVEGGRVVASGTAAELRARDDVQEFYLGSTSEGRVRYLPERWRRAA
jgi:branched-chain amino acid transport system ATP-binding protein